MFYSGTPNLHLLPTPTPFSNSPPRVTYRRIFSRLSTSFLTKGFTQALPSFNITPTPYIHALHTLKCCSIAATILLSYSQPCITILQLTQTKKPEIVHFYNSTKVGVDTVDQLCGNYSVSRRTRRWPLCIFFPTPQHCRRKWTYSAQHDTFGR